MLPWQQHSRCHSVSFARYISGAKFEEHYSNISEDILDSVFYFLSGTVYDVHHLHDTKSEHLKRKKIFQKGKHHSSSL